MLIYYHLRKAVKLRGEELRIKNYDPDIHYHEDPTFRTAVEDLYRSIYLWPQYAVNLTDIACWNIKALRDENNHFRRPRASLYLDINQSGNLVLEWDESSDRMRTAPSGEKDFYFSGSKSADWGEMPANRLVWIHNAAWIMKIMEPLPHSSKHFLQAVDEHINFITSVLGSTITVKLESCLYFEYEKIPDARPGQEFERLIKCDVVSMKEKKRRDDEKWLTATFREINMKPEDFLQIYRQANQKSTKCNKLLKDAGVKGLGDTGIEKIVRKLKEDFLGLYRVIFPEEVVANIIPFTQDNKTES